MGKLYKQQIIGMVAERLGCPKAPAAKAVDAVLGSIQSGLQENERVTLTGFGTFEVRPTQARRIRAIRGEKAGEFIEVPASHRVGFSSSSSLAKSVRDARS